MTPLAMSEEEFDREIANAAEHKVRVIAAYLIGRGYPDLAGEIARLFQSKTKDKP